MAFPVTLATASGRGVMVPTAFFALGDGATSGPLTGAPVRSDSPAACTAPMMAGYPAQRHSVSFNAYLMSSSLGLGLCSSSAYEVISCPGMQNPHCTAPY